MGPLERRVTRLENRLNSSREPQSLEEMQEAFERGEYGNYSVMSLVVSIHSALSQGVNLENFRHPRIPDKLFAFFVECVTKSVANRAAGESDTL